MCDEAMDNIFHSLIFTFNLIQDVLKILIKQFDRL